MTLSASMPQHQQQSVHESGNYTRRKLVCEILLSQVRYGVPLSRE